MATDAWSDIYPDQKAADRRDLVLEEQYVADESGFFTSDWYLTNDVTIVCVSARFANGDEANFSIEEGMWGTRSDPYVVHTHSLTVTSNKVRVDSLLLGTRAFRVQASGVGAGGVLYVTIRKV